MGTGNYSTGFGQVYDYWVLGPLGLHKQYFNPEPLDANAVTSSLWKVKTLKGLRFRAFWAYRGTMFNTAGDC